MRSGKSSVLSSRRQTTAERLAAGDGWEKVGKSLQSSNRRSGAHPRLTSGNGGVNTLGGVERRLGRSAENLGEIDISVREEDIVQEGQDTEKKRLKSDVW
jgi:hypothetical protein